MRPLTKQDALEQLELHKRKLLRHPDECVMCALSEQRDRALVLRQSRDGIAVLDRFGNRHGHLLVIAKRHVEHATQLSWDEYAALQRLAYEACQALERVLTPKRVFVAALGSSDTLPMTFSHFHLHVVPVLEDDERGRPAQVFSWTEGVVTYDDDRARELVDELCGAWPRSTSD
jgi:diadenosine tetraphosphate (Ap4A) HIT family hydrolase